MPVFRDADEAAGIAASHLIISDVISDKSASYANIKCLSSSACAYIGSHFIEASAQSGGGADAMMPH